MADSPAVPKPEPNTPPVRDVVGEVASDVAVADEDAADVSTTEGETVADATEGETVADATEGETVADAADTDTADVEDYDEAAGDEAAGDEAAGDEASGDEAADEQAADDPEAARRFSTVLAIAVGVVIVIALSALVGWLGFRANQSHQVADRRELFLQVGRQSAVNLTTIDYVTAAADNQRILDSATGTLYDGFSQRSQDFIAAVTHFKAKTVGTVTESGLESITDHDAQVLVSVSVKTFRNGVPDEKPRYWRMKVTVQEVGDQAKASNVQFVV